VLIPIEETKNAEQFTTSSYATEPAYQSRIVASRTWRDTIRNRMRLIGEGAQHLFVSIFLGLLYLQLGARTDTIYDINAALFYVMLQGSFTVAFTAGSQGM
jgi:hypothetical protein